MAISRGVDEGCFAMILALLFAAAGAWISFKTSNDLWKESCIKHGAAEYNQQSGRWQWKESALSPPQPTGE